MVNITTQTPGVYINEINAFGNSVVPVATAVPAFIGYTPQAQYKGKSYLNKPVQINSMADFEAYFTYPNPDPPAAPAKQYAPQYYLNKLETAPEKGNYFELNGDIYTANPDPNTVYYLYNSIRLFYKNGGGTAYIVSVGTYGKPSGKSTQNGQALINQNVQISDLRTGLTALKDETEPTMYVVPEATLLSPDENAQLMQEMLQQVADLQTAVCIFDLIGADDPDPVLYTQDIEAFRNGVGNNNLKYGVAYFPFVGTTIMQQSEIDYTNLNGGDVKALDPIVNPPSHPNPDAEKVLQSIENPPDHPLTVTQYNNALTTASKQYSQLMEEVLQEANILPPSGAMASIYTTVDNTQGVWKAPANIAPVGVTSLPINITPDQQEDLNVPVSGKAVNAIRSFASQGILVWGARTLDGNSQDWRYINIRRTVTYIEQSVKLAARAYVFEPNDANTWAAVKSMISNFLTELWNQGGLQGTKATDAFSVEVGLGTTMTSEDILNGYMNVIVKVAVEHPAEFIVITFQQQQATSS